MSLTKAELLLGKDNTKTVPIEALGGDVKIRPLTDGEFQEIQSLFVDAVQMNIGLTKADFDGKTKLDKDDLAEKLETTVDVAQFASADHRSNVLATMYGLSVSETETWDEKEVNSLPPGSAEQIAAKVYDFSGAHPEQEVLLRRFRDDGSGTIDSADTDDGSSVGSDTKPVDSGPADLPGRSREAALSDGGGDG